MTIRSKSLSVLFGILAFSVSLFGADPRKDFDEQLNRVIAKLNRQAGADVEAPVVLAGLIQRTYGTRSEELRWASSHVGNWGEIAALAYIQATTGRSFEAMTEDNARRDFWSYVEKVEMSSDKMTRSLESFLKLAETERNSRIFERLRVSRRIQPMPDLGSGFGLFQEALDFRRIDSPRITKVHSVAGGKAKGDQ